MKIIYCDHSWKEIWNQFVTANSFDAGFLQSWQWGEFYKTRNQEVYRLVVADDGGAILAVAQLIRMPLPLHKSYFYIPRGPIMQETRNKSQNTKNILEYLFSEIKLLAQKEKAIFLRFDPAWVVENHTQDDGVLPPPLNLLPRLAEAPAKRVWQGEKIIPVGQVQPKQTLILDITKSEEQLLAQMKAKCRYNIKVAQKHCIKIDEGVSYIEDFISLTRQTALRDEFVSHSDDYYQKMLSALSVDGTMKLFVAKDGDKVIVANLVIFFGDWCVYLHGASDYQYRDKMAPYLLQWEMIQLAKSHGKKYYDFWGVGEAKWSGVTRFKQGFSPEQPFTQYVGAYDLPVSRVWYGIYRMLKR